MVAVVSANGLGLFDSSLSQLGTLFGGQAGIGQSRESQMVNIANGNLLLQDLDETLDVRGFDADLLRTYNSRGLLSGVGQDGFVTGYERSVTLSGTLNTATSTVTLAAGDGQLVVFKYSGTANKYVASAGSGANDTLTWNASTHQWTLVEGSTQRQEVYADSADPVLKGRLLAIKDGRSLAEFDVIYDSNNRVSEVRSLDDTGGGSNADAIVFGYYGTSNQLISVSTRENGVLRPQLTYGYDSFGRLAYVQTDLTPSNSGDNVWNSANPAANDGCLYRTTYTYTNQSDGSDLRIANVTTSDGVSVSYTYESDGAGGYRVKTVTQGTGSSAQTVTFTYHPDSGDTAGYTDVTDGDGRTWSYYYDVNGQLTQVLEPPVGGLRTVTTYTYDTASGNVKQIKTVRGSATLAETDCSYDANGNLSWKWQQVDGTGAFTAVHYTYNTANQVLTEVRYAALDPDGPGTTAPSGTGALTTTFVYDSQNRLRFTIDAAGDVTERTYASSGNGVGQLATVRQYLGTTYAVANGVTESALMTWAAGQLATSTLSTYSYDVKGRLQMQVDYADVDTSTTDGHTGDGVLDAAAAITRFAYSAQGLLLQKIVVHGSSADRAATVAGTLLPTTGLASPTASDDGSEVTDYTYDGMGRLLSVIRHDLQDGVGNDTYALSTTYAYTDSTGQIKVTLDSGAVETRSHDSTGELVSDSVAGTVEVNGQDQQVTRTTSYYYDVSGLLRATQDAMGGISYLFYDGQGRVTAQVDATGAVTAVGYDDIDHQTTSTAYATRVDTSAWLSNGVVTVDTPVFSASSPSLGAGQFWVPVDAANDRSSTNVYDDLGRLLSQTDAAGLVTSYVYDGQSHLTSVTVAKPGDATVIPRVTHYYYDKADRQVGVVDAGGYLTESVYDTAGHLIKTIRYATLAKTGTTLTAQRPAVNAADMITRYFYDGRDQLVGQLAYVGGTTTAATGYLTVYGYDEQLHQISAQAYSLQLGGLTGSETLASLQATAQAAVTAGTATVRTSQSTYNGLGQLASQSNYEGTLTTYTYDEAGRLVQTQVDANEGAALERDTFVRYDVFGEVIGQVSGEQAAQADASLPTGQVLSTATLGESTLDTAYGTYGTTFVYDANGRVTQSTDALGNRSWFYYDADGRQTYAVRGNLDGAGNLNRRGEVTQTRYNAFGQAIAVVSYTNPIVLAANATWASVQAALPTAASATDTQRLMSYDQRGLLTQAVDGESAVTNYTYTAFGQLYQQQGWVGTTAAETIQYGYDARGEETSRTDGLGTSIARTLGWTYDAFGRIATSTDAMGTVTNYTYDRLGRQLSHYATVESRLETWSATYDAFDRTLTQTDAVGNITQYSYDDAHRSMTVTTAEGIAVTSVHTAFGQTLQVTTAAGVTSYQYDRNGALLQTTDANGKSAADQYDKLGRLIETVDESNRTIDYRYDAASRVLRRIVDPAGLALTTSYAYDAQGRQVQVTDASGRVTQTAYDREGRVLTVTLDPNGLNLVTRYDRDAAGREVLVTQGYGTAAASAVQYVYDTLGRRSKEIVDPTGLALTTTYGYDANDNLVSRTDGLGHVTRYVYNASNSLRYTIDAAGGVTEMRYDADERVVMTTAYATPISLSGLSVTPTTAQVASRIVASAVDQTSYRIYDQDSKLRFVVDGRGDVAETRYDAAARAVARLAYLIPVTLTSSDLTALAGGTMTASTFASRSDLASQSSTANMSMQVLDGDGRVRFSVDTLGDVTEFRYDAAGRQVEQLTYVTRLNLQQADLNSLAAGTFGVNAMVALVATQASTAIIGYRIYDAAGRARFAVDALGDVRETRYDAAGRVVEQLGYAAAITLTSADLAALPLGTCTAESFVQEHTELAAQEAGAMVSWNVYDAAGQLRFTVDGLGDVNELRYDAAGRVTERLAYVTPIGLTAARPSLCAGTYPATTMAGRSDLVNQEAQAHASYQVLDAAGRVRYTVTRALVNGAVVGAVSENRYDAAGELVAQVRYATTVAFDPTQTVASLAALVTATGGDLAANQRITRLVYDADGRLRFTVGDLGTVSEKRYDGIGRAIASVSYDATVPVQDYTESALATLLATSSYAGMRQTTYAYDGAGRLQSTTRVLNGTTSYTESYLYDAAGHRTSLTNALGNTWTYVYDRAGRQTEIHTPQVYVTRFDANGNPLAPSQESLVTKVGYDAAGNVICRTEAYGTSEARTTSYVYDVRGYQTKTILPDAWAVNASGVLAATGVTPEIDVIYDALGRAVSETRFDNPADPNARKICSYKVYDLQGRLAYDIDAAGNATGYTYDALGENVTLTRYAKAIDTTKIPGFVAGQAITASQMAISGVLVATPAQDRTLTTVYDAAGNKQSVTQAAVTYTRADGTTATGSPVTRFAFDAYGELVKQSVLLQGTPGVDGLWTSTYNYYDDLGRRTMSVEGVLSSDAGAAPAAGTNGGYVTAWQYTSEGEVKLETQYARALSATVLASLSAAAAPAQPAPGDAIIGYDRVTRYDYDALGRKTAQTAVATHFERADGSGGARDVQTVYGYDGIDEVTSVNADGILTQTQYDALGHATAVIQAQRSILASGYDGQLTGDASVSLGTLGLYVQSSPYTAIAYDSFGDAVQVRQYANGLLQGQTTAVADNARDRITTTQYDRMGRAAIEHDGEGNVVARKYDASGNLLEVDFRLDGNDGRWSNVRWTAAYDALNRQILTQVFRDRYLTSGGTTTSQGTVTDQVAQVRYNAFGEIVAQGDLSDLNATLEAQFTYDQAGRLVASNSQGGVARSYGYNLAGYQLSESHAVTTVVGRNADGSPATTNVTATTRQVTDALGRVIQTLLPSWNDNLTIVTAITQTFDRWGNVIESIDPRGFVTDYSYNQLDQKVSERQPMALVVGVDGSQTWTRPEVHWFYGATGRLEGTRDANGNISRTVYDAAGQKIQTIDALNNVTRLAYDAFGDQVLSQDPMGYITFQNFDRNGRVVAQGDYTTLEPNTPAGTRARTALQSYGLDQNGDRIRITDAATLGNTGKYDYDSRSLLLRSQTAAGVVMNYAYDANGRKTLEEDGDTTHFGVQTWATDYFGRTTAHGDLSGKSNTYTYDPQSGQLVRQTNQNGLDRIISYYANGRVKQIGESQSGGVNTIYQYDASGNCTVEDTQSTDAKGMALHMRTTTEYDSHNRVQRVVEDDLITGKRTLDLTYTYDAQGNRRQVVATSGYGTNTTPISTTNQAPVVIKTVPAVKLRTGYAASFSINPTDVFRDPELDALTVTPTLLLNGVVQAWPSWLSCATDAATGMLVFTTTGPGTDAIATYTIQLQASDSHSNTVTTSFSLGVVTDSTPTSSGTGQTSFIAKSDQDLSIEFAASVYFKDADVGDVISVAKGTTLPPSWLIADTSNPSVLRFTASQADLAAHPGTYTFTIKGVDSQNHSVSRTITLLVTPDRAPLATGIAPQDATLNNPFDLLRNLSDVFNDPDGDALSVTASLANGDDLPPWLSFQYLNDQATPQIRLSGVVPPDETVAHVYQVKLTATDPEGQTVSTTVAITIQPNRPPVLVGTPPALAAVANTVFATDLSIPGLFLDADGDPLLFQLAPGAASWLSLSTDYDNGLLHLTGTPPANILPGNTTVQIIATDPDGQSVTLNLNLTIVNNVPVFTAAQPDITIYGNKSFSVTVPPMSNPAGLPLTYTYIATDQYMNQVTPFTLDGNGTFTGGGYGDNSWVKVKLIVSWQGGSVSEGFKVTYSSASAPANSAPVVATALPSQQHILPGQAWAYTVPPSAFSDADFDVLTWSATVNGGGSWPTGLAFNAATRTFSATSSLASGTYALAVTVSDGRGGTCTQSFNLKVQPNHAPTVANTIPDQSLAIGGYLNYTFPLSVFSDFDGDPRSYSASNLPVGVFFDPSSRSFTGYPPAGRYTITVTATDPFGASVSTSFNLVVGPPANQGPVLSAIIPPQTATTGSPWSFTLPPGLFTDPDNDALTLSVTGPGWLSFDGVGTLTATPTQSGSWGIQVTASDGHGHTVKSIFNLTVTANNAAPLASVAIPAQTLSQGQDWSYTLAGGTFTDPNGNPLRYTATGLPPGISFDATSGTFSGQATTIGTYTVTVTADDGHGGLVSQNVTMTVVNFTDHAPVRAVAIPAQVWTRNQGNSFTFASGTFTDADGDDLAYTATLASGAALPSWLTFDPDTRTFLGVPPSAGPWSVMVTADDGHGGTATATFQLTSTTTSVKQQSAWYTYDALNRVSVANGSLVNGQVAVDPNLTGSYMNLYDAAGHLVGTEHSGADLYENAAGVVLTQQVVNARGQTVATYADRMLDDTHVQLASTNTYDDDGRLLQTLEYFPPHWSYTFYEGDGTPIPMSVSGLLKSATVYQYDADGRLQVQTQYRRPVATDSGQDAQGNTHTWPKWIEDLSLAQALSHGQQDPAQYTSLGVLEVDSIVSYTGTSNGTTLGYDAAGRLVGYAFTQKPDASGANGFTQTFAETYQGYDSWQEWTVAGSSTDGAQRPTTTTIVYDAAGREVSMTEHTTNVPQGMTIDDRLKLFVSDAEGEIVRRRDGTVNTSGTFTPTSDPNDATVAQQAIHHYVYAQGQEVAGLDEAGTIDAISHVTAFSNSVLGSEGVVVQDGDTLQTIAQRVYGTSDLWYVLASANGLNADAVLVEGVTLKAPQVLTSVNDASTFKPYDPADITGPSTPSLPQIKDPPKEHCSAFAKILIIIVVAVLTVLSAGAAALAMSGATSFSFGAAMSAGFSALTGAGVTMSTVNGAVVTAGTAGATTTVVASSTLATAAFTGGVIGSTASQILSDAAGISKGFSIKNVIAGGLTAMAGSYLGGVIGEGKDLPTLLSQSQYGRIGAMAVADNLAGYGANKVVGNRIAFSWKSVLASGVAAVASAGVSRGLGLTTDNFQDNLVNGLIGGSINAESQHAIAGGPNPDWSGIAEDAFGNAIANGVENASMGGSFWGPADSGDPAHPFPSARQLAASAHGSLWVPDPRGGYDTVGDMEAYLEDMHDPAASQSPNALNADQINARRRMEDASSAGLVGAGAPIDPLDITRNRYGGAFASAMDKFGGDAIVLYEPTIVGFMAHASAGDQFLSESYGKVFTADEVRAVSAYLQDAGIPADYTKVAPDSMILLVAPGASENDVYGDIRGSLGKLVTGKDMIGVVPVDDFSKDAAGNMRTDRSYSFNLTPLEETIMVRFNEKLFMDPRVLQAAEKVRGASDALIATPDDLPRFSMTSDKKLEMGMFENMVGVVRSEMLAAGDMPARIVAGDTMQMAMTQIGLALVGIGLGEGMSGLAGVLERTAVGVSSRTLVEMEASGVNSFGNIDGLAGTVDKEGAVQQLAATLRYRALGWNHEQGKFSIIETMAISRAEKTFGKTFLPSDIEGVDVIDPNGWGNVSLKGPFLNKDLQPLTEEQQMKAVSNVATHIEQNTAVDTHIIDLTGMSETAEAALRQALQNAKQRIIFMRGY